MGTFHFGNNAFTIRRHHSEADYEAFLIPHLQRMLPEYHILPFRTGVFASHEYGVRRADLVFIHKEYLNWVVVEVELSHHSLDSHVFPQAFTFRNGEYKIKHVEYLLEKKPDLDSYQLEYLLIYNPPDVLVIVDNPIVYERGWDRLTDVCELAIAVPFRNDNSEYGLFYEGWTPTLLSNITRAIWNKAACFLEVFSPSIIFDASMERCILLIDGRPSEWMSGQIRSSIVLYPVNQWVKQFLNDNYEYTLQLNPQGEYEIIQ